MSLTLAYLVAVALAGLVAHRAVRIRARRRRAPAFAVTPGIGYCRVRTVAEIATAWRARGFVVVARRRRIDVRTPDGARAELEVPRGRRLGDAPFTLRSHHAGLVHDLLAIASCELGPLVCWIDGYVHGFDTAPLEPHPAPVSSPPDAVTLSLRP